MNNITETVIAAVVLVGVFALGHQYSSDQWEKKWTARDAADLAASKQFTQDQRRIELQRQGEIDAIQKSGDDALAKAKRDADRANAESKRLRTGITEAIARLQSGGGDTAVTGSGSAKTSTGLLLAELFGEIDRAAGEYAEEADRRGVAWKVCVDAYNSVRAAK